MSIKEQIKYDELVDMDELSEAIADLNSEERMELAKELFPNFKFKAVKMGVNRNGANEYRVTVQNNDSKFSTKFTDSIYNSQRGEKSDDFNMLYCIILDAEAYDTSASLEDFADDFGYDLYEDRKKTEKIFNACEKQYNNLIKLFGTDGYRVLRELTYNF